MVMSQQHVNTAPVPVRLVVRNLQAGAILSMLVMALLPLSTHAQSQLTDDANTNTTSKSTDSNFGTNPNLFVNAAGNVYIKFKLSSTLPPATPGTAIDRATLKLYLANINVAGKLDVYALAGAWD